MKASVCGSSNAVRLFLLRLERAEAAIFSVAPSMHASERRDDIVRDARVHVACVLGLFALVYIMHAVRVPRLLLMLAAAVAVSFFSVFTRRVFMPVVRNI